MAIIRNDPRAVRSVEDFTVMTIESNPDIVRCPVCGRNAIAERFAGRMEYIHKVDHVDIDEEDFHFGTISDRCYGKFL